MPEPKIFSSSEVDDFIRYCLRTGWVTVANSEKMKADINSAVATSWHQIEGLIDTTSVSAGLTYLFEQEILNEKEGGVSPATLESCLDSLEQGLTLEPRADTEAVNKELTALITKLGKHTEVEDLQIIERNPGEKQVKFP